MSSRDAILSAIRAHSPRSKPGLPSVPLFDEDPAADLLQAFYQAFERMGGEILAPNPTDPLAAVRDKLGGARIICSKVSEIAGNKLIGPKTKPAELADVDYGILRAAFAVAETGSLCFTERELGINTLGYLPQHLIVLLDPADVVLNLHHAYHRDEFRTAFYAVLQSGPSATADIEGVLIHGAQGVRSLSVLILKR